MARSWGGSGTNYLEYTVNSVVNCDTTLQSYSFWIYLPSIPGTTCIVVMSIAYAGANDHRTIIRTAAGTGGTGFWIGGSLKFSGANKVWSQGALEADIALNAWHHIAVIIDRTGSGSVSLWVDGVQRSLTVSLPIGSAATGTDSCRIGLNSAGAQQLANATLADMAFWDLQLSSTEIGELARGVNPYSIQKANLRWCPPLYGVDSPEPDYRQNVTVPITGTISYAAHPPVMGPARSRRVA